MRKLFFIFLFLVYLSCAFLLQVSFSLNLFGFLILLALVYYANPLAESLQQQQQQQQPTQQQPQDPANLIYTQNGAIFGLKLFTEIIISNKARVNLIWYDLNFFHFFF